MNMKKVLTWLLISAMLFTTVMAPAPTFAADKTTAHIEETIRALGIMSGDSNGDLALNRLISRAEFAQMMVNASVFKGLDNVSSGTSIFKDVKYDYWAADSVKIAVQSGWFTGYLDGTFKPTRFITLEEGATALLKLLGYTNADLVGTYPSAQLSKFNTLGLSDGVHAKQGQKLTRQDAMHMFFNMMHTKTKAGQIYAQTLGHPMLGDEIDYSLLVQSVTEGPFVLKKGNISAMLPFAVKSGNVTVYRNSVASSLEEILPYDVYYYSKNLRTVWAFSQKITGLYTAALPTASAPSTVVVAGGSYPIGSSEAAFALSTKGKFGFGDTITLLLGMNGDVVSVLAPELSNETVYGVVTKYETLSYKDSSGKLISENSVMVAGTDGVVRQFMVGGLTFSAGNIVSVTYTNSESVVKLLGDTYLTGSVDADATGIGTYKFAKEVEIIDVSTAGGFAKLYPNRLAGASLSSSNDVRYYTLDSNGAVNRLILNNITGDLNTYGIVTDVDETTTVIDNVAPIPDTVMLSGIYEYLIKGMPGVMRTSDRLLEIATGPAMFTYKDGLVNGIQSLGGLSLSAISDIKATSLDGIQQYGVAQDVQVYEIINGKYFTVNISTVANTNAYKLTGYRDSGYRLGGLIRVIVAVKK
jgi:hypothetical protein